MSGWLVVPENAAPWVHFFKDDFSRVAEDVYASASIGPLSQPFAFAIHDASNRIAVGWLQSATVMAISIYNTSTGLPVPERKITFNVANGNAIKMMQFKLDGSALFVVVPNESLRWFNPATGAALGNTTATPIPAQTVNGADIDPSGRNLVMALGASPWLIFAILGLGTSAITGVPAVAHETVKWSKDGAYLAIWLNGQTQNLYVRKYDNINSFSAAITISAQPAGNQGGRRGNSIGWCAKNGRQYLVTHNTSLGTLWMWETSADGNSMTYIAPPAIGGIDRELQAVSFSSDGAFMYAMQLATRLDHIRCYAMPAAAGQTYTRVWPNLSRQPQHTAGAALNTGVDMVCSIGVGTPFPENKQIAISGTDNPGIAVFRNDTFSQRLAIPNNVAPNGRRGVAMTPDGIWMAWASATQWFVGRIDDAGTTQIYNFGNLPAGNQVSGSIAATALRNDGKMLAFQLNATPFIAVYNVETGAKLADPATLPPAPGGSGNGLTFNNNRNKLVVCSGTGTDVRVYDVTTSAITFNSNLAVPSPPICPAFSDDDTKLAISLGGGIGIRTFTVSNLGQVFTQDTDGPNPGGGAYVASGVAFTPDGTQMVVQMAFPPPRIFFQTYPGKVPRASNTDAATPTSVKVMPAGTRVAFVSTTAPTGVAEIDIAAPNTFYQKANAILGGITVVWPGNYTKVASAYPLPGTPQPQICTVQ